MQQDTRAAHAHVWGCDTGKPTVHYISTPQAADVAMAVRSQHPPQVSFDSRPPLQAPACQCQVGCWFLSVMRVKEANHDQSFWPVSALAGKDMAHQDDNAGNHSSRSSLTLSFTSSTAKCANGLTLQPASSQLCPSFHQHKLTCSVLRKNCTPGSFRCLHATNIPRATQSLYLQSKPQTP